MRKPGFTLVEIVVASAIAVSVAAVALVAIGSSRRPVEAGSARAARAGELRLAIDRMGRELRSARQVLYPAPLPQGTPAGPLRCMVFRDFEGRFVLYSFEPAAGEIHRTLLPLDGVPVVDAKPLAAGLSEALFTVSSRRVVSLLLVRDGVPLLHSVRMLNG